MPRAGLTAFAVGLALLALVGQTPAADKRCFCFDWVHHAEFGKECHESMRACRRAHKQWGLSGMRTPCKPSQEKECIKWGCRGPGECYRYGCPAEPPRDGGIDARP